MHYRDLREFLNKLEELKLLKRISHPIDPRLEMTEVCDRTLKIQGPALLFDNPKGFDIPVLGNLFGTTERIVMAMGKSDLSQLRELGQMLAFLKEPEPPNGWRDAWRKMPLFKRVLSMSPKMIQQPACQQVVYEKNEVDLTALPIQTCWPGDVAPLITWGLVITQGPHQKRQNLGIYRQQLLDKNKLIMRWLAHRGGALDFQAWQRLNPGQPFPVAVALGADPATTLAAVVPIPDSLSEYAFAGLLRGHKTELTKCLTHSLSVPASAEIILEGFIYTEDVALEGPYGDHTGYYNEVETFPVFTVERITHREHPIYHSTYTGRPPDEPALLGVALNELLIPLLQKQFPEVVDFYLPPAACSYRMAVVSIRKKYPGHARQIMMGVWSYLKQFMYTKFIIVVDEDINARNWSDVVWAIATRVDPARDTMIVNKTPIDYLDFASPMNGLGSKMGLDATEKWSGETSREWGKVIKQDSKVMEQVDIYWDSLGIHG